MSNFEKEFREALGSGATLVKAAAREDARMAFARSVADGLSDDPKWLHCRFLYDERGSQLFEEITEQPEYYPTRTEAAILARHADDIQRITGPVTLVELGSGYSVKTEHLLTAYTHAEGNVHYVPVDVSVSALEAAKSSIAESFEAVSFTGIAGTYANAFTVFPQLSPQMIIFLGSTIGNFNEAEADAFWNSVSGQLPAGDWFLLGVDLVKDVSVLEAAYNDAAGVTPRFTKNYFARMNRELGSDIDLSTIEHVATWNAKKERIDIRSRFEAEQEIYIEPLDRRFHIDAGEEILIEISRKFRVHEVSEKLAEFGLETARTFTDPKNWFALILLRRTDEAAPQPSTNG